MKRTKKQLRELQEENDFKRLKDVLRHLPKQEFISYALLYCDQIQRLKVGSRRYNYYVRLFEWCKSYYVVRYVMNLNENK